MDIMATCSASATEIPPMMKLRYDGYEMRNDVMMWMMRWRHDVLSYVWPNELYEDGKKRMV